MVTRSPARNARTRHVRRGAHVTILTAVVVLVSALLVPTSASATASVQTLFNSGTISVRSGDGCTVRPAPPGGGRNYVRNLTCTIKTKPLVLPVMPGAPRIKTLFNGDKVALVSGDGCRLKPAAPSGGRKYMRNFTCLKSGLTTPPPPGNGQPPAGVTGGATWRTVWDDEFSGTAVDPTKWNVADNSNFGAGNNEDECYKAANTTEAGGTLRLTGKRQTVTGCGANPDGGNTYFFTSGMVDTTAQGGAAKMKFRQGYAEVRMRVPRGNIYWPAFWLVGAGDGSSPGWPAYGEVDVTEIYGSRPDVSESNFWRTGGDIGAQNNNVNNPTSSNVGINVNPPNAFVAGGTNSWHTYGVNWTASRLDWYIDGIKVRTHTATTNAELVALAYEHSIILNLAMGGDGPRSSDHGYTGIEAGGTYNNGNLVADLPGTMEIDYARVWQP